MAKNSGKQREVAEIIDQAIRENRHGEFIAYFIILVAVGGGIAAFVQAFMTDNWLWAAAGGTPGIFLWPALNYTLKIGKQNKAIRLLELPLSRAASEASAAQILQDFFVTVFEMRN